jgi:hypothetical protein
MTLEILGSKQVQTSKYVMLSKKQNHRATFSAIKRQQFSTQQTPSLS